MAGANTIVGSGSLMSEDHYIRKMEQTKLYEDPMAMDNFYRRELKNMKPDKPIFESDMPRYENKSYERLNLRYHGTRSEFEPYLPDGTFLDHDFLSKDPRGNAVGPDFKQYRKQQEARTKFIRHGNDADNSIPSSGWSPHQVIVDIKNQMPNLKQRLKIFDESQLGMQRGRVAVNRLDESKICLFENDERKPIMRDEICGNRANYVHELSNFIPTGWMRTTDHKFKIAKYGQLRPLAPLSTQNWSKNRSNTKLDHDILVSWKDQVVPKSLMLKMIDLSKQKYNEMESGKNVLFGEDTTQDVRSRKLTPRDLAGIQAQNSVESQDETSSSSINSNNVSHISGRTLIHNPNDKKIEKAVIDPDIIEQILSINRKMAPRDMDDLRDHIEQSDEEKGIMIEEKNATSRGLDRLNELLWSVNAEYDKGESMKIANYGRLAKNTIVSRSNQCDTVTDQITTNSKILGQRKSRLAPSTMYNMNTVEYDTQYGPERLNAKLVGPMGSKYMRKYLDSDLRHDMADISASSRRLI